MSTFGNLKTDGLEETQDRLGGFAALETDSYTGTIMLAYGEKSKGGALGVNIHYDFKGKQYRETYWVTNKKGENWFLNPNDKNKKVPLPGFTVVEDICLMTTGKGLADQKEEDKIVNIYDYDAKKELPKSVPVLIDLIGQDITLGIIQEIVNKNEKNDSTGEYTAIAESRNQNVVDKVFHYPSNVTMAEARKAEADGTTAEPLFHAAWVEKNKGITRDKRTIKDGSTGAPQSGRPSGAAPTTGKPTSSLFGKK